MSAKESALELLSQGISASQVALTIGVQESYISQLLTNEDFATQVQERRIAASKEDLDYDKKLDRVEAKFLDRIEEKSGFANLQQSLQAFKTVNGARRRRDSGVVQQGQNHSTVVVIQIPTAMVPKYTLNAQSEIVDVEGTTMVSASPKGVEEMLAEKKAREKLAGLPAPSAETQEILQKLEDQDTARAVQMLNQAIPVKKTVRRVPDFMSIDSL